ncbi:dipeptidase PepE [Paraburkholderia sp. J63]|uniref:dipeptidase PepE n=1 Tax=Paraburkholderia sp. J63 TaxID=2805434 RepID=UPI002ABD2093|nr:dipeptidase PepE [Paraburkholderia sp. J63]
MNQRILLMSSSRKDNLGYLEHAGAQIHAVLKHEKQHVAFVPFAAVTFDFDTYEGLARPVFEQLGYGLTSIHRSANLRETIERADAIAVGGGNTFALLSRMYEADIVEAIREKVRAGTPYIGWSAGSNVACPTIRTTNDMPIVQPPTLRALGLVPFQINPHFISGKPAGHNGESREERLAEFMTINAPEQVFALPEGSALLSNGSTGTVLGERGALHFTDAKNAATLAEGASFDLKDVVGPTGFPSWPNFSH